MKNRLFTASPWMFLTLLSGSLIIGSSVAGATPLFYDSVDTVYNTNSYVVDASYLDDTDDDTTNLQTALDTIPAGAELIIPAGTLTLSSAITVDRSRLSIRGLDETATFLKFTNATDGLVFVADAEKGVQIDLSDLTIEAGANGSGSAIATSPGLSGVTALLTLQRVTIIGDSSTGGYWDSSVKTNAGSIKSIDCHMLGIRNGSSGTSYHINFTGHGGGGKRPVLVRTILRGADKGINVYDSDQEGAMFYDVVVDDVRVGAHKENDGEPAFNWISSRIKAKNRALEMVGARDSYLAGSIFEVESSNGTVVVLSERTTLSVNFRGCILLSDASKTGTTLFSAGEDLVDDVSFSGNLFSGSVTGFDLTGTDTRHFSFGGNIWDEVTTQHSFGTSANNIWETELEDYLY